jgi:hypothetical protein
MCPCSSRNHGSSNQRKTPFNSMPCWHLELAIGGSHYSLFFSLRPQVRRSVPKITLPMVLELVEAQEWGPSAPKIPPTAAKERLAHITAAKAVALALTPGLDPIKVSVTSHCHTTLV